MRLSKETYFAPEMQLKYMGSTQFKDFVQCEAAAMARIRGEWSPEQTVAQLVGSYVDAYFEGTLAGFTLQHPELFTRTGALRAEFQQAEKIIRRLKRDAMFMKYMAGKKQVIKTGKIAGVPFKIKMDSYHPGKCIVDMKIVKDFQPIWMEGQGKLSFVEAWGYDTQGAIYQAIEGKRLPFFIAAATKEKEPDLAIISIPQSDLDVCLELVEDKAPRFQQIKKGLIAPQRCGKCDWCKSTKVLTETVHYDDI